MIEKGRPNGTQHGFQTDQTLELPFSSTICWETISTSLTVMSWELRSLARAAIERFSVIHITRGVET